MASETITTPEKRYPPGCRREAADIWRQQEHEPDVWYQRFDAYRSLGPRRALLTVYQAERTGRAATDVPATWYDAAETWHWRERAIAWDAEEAVAIATAEQRMRMQGRTERVATLKALRAKLVQALQGTEPTGERWKEISEGLMGVTERLRVEQEG